MFRLESEVWSVVKRLTQALNEPLPPPPPMVGFRCISRVDVGYQQRYKLRYEVRAPDN